MNIYKQTLTNLNQVIDNLKNVNNIYDLDEHQDIHELINLIDDNYKSLKGKIPNLLVKNRHNELTARTNDPNKPYTHIGLATNKKTGLRTVCGFNNVMRTYQMKDVKLVKFDLPVSKLEGAKILLTLEHFKDEESIKIIEQYIDKFHNKVSGGKKLRCIKEEIGFDKKEEIDYNNLSLIERAAMKAKGELV